MIKRIQNKVAESRYTLPTAATYGVVIWLVGGLIQQQWWIQFACFAIATYLMVELNNSNALIRIYSRSVSALFIVLSCIASFLFPSIEGAITQVCLVASLLFLFRSYQDKKAAGSTFYAFLFLTLGSLAHVHTLWLIPVYWIIMVFFIYSMSIRTFVASLLGFLLPYWCLFTWVLWRYGDDFSLFTQHFEPLGDYHVDPTTLSLPLMLTFAFIVVLSITGLIHYLRTSFLDKIRIRQIYYSFIFLDAVSAVFLILQPQQYDMTLRVMIIATSPLIAHFISLTRTRFTNIAFFAILGVALILTVFHLWISLFSS